MGIFRKQTTRAPLTTVLLVLLLALSITASSIGFTVWTSVKRQAETLDQQYTTIAIPIEQDAFRDGVFTIHEDGGIEYSDGYCYPIEEATALHGVLDVKTGLTVCRHPLTTDTRIGFEKAYTIVEIYTAPEFIFGVHNFHADTILTQQTNAMSGT